jgi:hypothetical protein
MLEVLDAVEHVGEIARLFLVLARRQRHRTEETALIESCRRTAGLSIRYPRPKPAIALAVSAGLLTLADGIISLTDQGRKFAAQNEGKALDLSQVQAKLLLAALLDDQEIESAATLLLGSFQQVRGQLVARKTSISQTDKQLLFCRVLQQLGAITVAGDYYVLARTFENLFAHVVLRTAKLTQAELLHRLESQRLRGELAEKTVMKIEQHRLIKLRRPDLAAKVQWLSPDDVSAGYDIQSYEVTERPRFIEVKSSVGRQVTFEWSSGERATAAEKGDAYYVYFVPFSFTLPALTAPVILIQNPLAHIASGRLVEKSASYYVTQSSRLATQAKAPPNDVIVFGKGLRDDY